MLRPDVVMAQAPRFVDGQLDDLLGAGSQADLTHHLALPAPDDEFDGTAHLGQLDAHDVRRLAAAVDRCCR